MFFLGERDVRHIKWLVEQLRMACGKLNKIIRTGSAAEKTQAEKELRYWAVQQWPTLRKIIKE